MTTRNEERARRRAGALVRERRLAAGMTMIDVGAAAQASMSTLSGIEAGDLKPSREKLLEVLRVIGLDRLERERVLADFGHLPADLERALLGNPEVWDSLRRGLATGAWDFGS